MCLDEQPQPLPSGMHAARPSAPSFDAPMRPVNSKKGLVPGLDLSQVASFDSEGTTRPTTSCVRPLSSMTRSVETARLSNEPVSLESNTGRSLGIANMPWQKELSGPKNVYFDTAALSRYEKMMLETSLQRRMTPPLRQHTETTDSEESDSQSQSAFDTESEARHPSPRRMDAIPGLPLPEAYLVTYSPTHDCWSYLGEALHTLDKAKADWTVASPSPNQKSSFHTGQLGGRNFWSFSSTTEASLNVELSFTPREYRVDAPSREEWIERESSDIFIKDTKAFRFRGRITKPPRLRKPALAADSKTPRRREPALAASSSVASSRPTADLSSLTSASEPIFVLTDYSSKDSGEDVAPVPSTNRPGSMKELSGGLPYHTSRTAAYDRSDTCDRPRLKPVRNQLSNSANCEDRRLWPSARNLTSWQHLGVRPRTVHQSACPAYGTSSYRW